MLFRSEIDREFGGRVEDMPFIHIALEESPRKGGGKILVLRADPRADPRAEP